MERHVRIFEGTSYNLVEGEQISTTGKTLYNALMHKK